MKDLKHFHHHAWRLFETSHPQKAWKWRKENTVLTPAAPPTHTRAWRAHRYKPEHRPVEPPLESVNGETQTCPTSTSNCASTPSKGHKLWWVGPLLSGNNGNRLYLISRQEAWGTQRSSERFSSFAKEPLNYSPHRFPLPTQCQHFLAFLSWQSVCAFQTWQPYPSLLSLLFVL